MIRGVGEGTAEVSATYTDPMGNEMVLRFKVRSTFFPFAAKYISTSLFSQGTYNEKTRTFKTGEWGQMGWEYQNGADMSNYKYLVIKLKQTASGSHLNIFTANSIWSPNHETSDFGSRKQIVVNLQTAKYTSDGDMKGKPLDTKNIRIVSFWSNRGTIVVDNMYLTNNSDYSPEQPSGIKMVEDDKSRMDNAVYDLQGRRLPMSDIQQLMPGVYIINGKKTIVR